MDVSRRKVLLYANSDWFMYNFNKDYMCHLVKSGFLVTVAVPSGPFCSELDAAGVDLHQMPSHRSGLNIINLIKLFYSLFKICKECKCSVVHAYTLPCVLILLCVRVLFPKINCVYEVTGFGSFFTGGSFKNKIFSFLIRVYIYIFSFFSRLDKVVLLNTDDYKIVDGSFYFKNFKKELIFGVGVNCNKYLPSYLPLANSFNVLMPSRVLLDKGVVEFIISSIVLSNKYKNIRFYIAGSLDVCNPSCLSKSTLEYFVDKKYIHWLGHVNNINSLYSSMHLVCLPSYREGLPTCLVEASMCSIPIVTTIVPGCNDAVINNLNGIKVPAKSPIYLVSAIEYLFLNYEKWLELRVKSRKFAIDKFSSSSIFSRRLNLYS